MPGRVIPYYSMHTLRAGLSVPLKPISSSLGIILKSVFTAIFSLFNDIILNVYGKAFYSFIKSTGALS